MLFVSLSPSNLNSTDIFTSLERDGARLQSRLQEAARGAAGRRTEPDISPPEGSRVMKQPTTAGDHQLKKEWDLEVKDKSLDHVFLCNREMVLNRLFLFKLNARQVINKVVSADPHESLSCCRQKRMKVVTIIIEG